MMRYETPELTGLMSALDAIQSSSPLKRIGPFADALNPVLHNETIAAYADWE